MTTEPTNVRAPRRNGHDANKHSISAADSQCPTCDQPISTQKMAEIVGKQRAHDLDIQRAVEARFVRQIAEVERKKKSEIATAVGAATKALRDGQTTIVAAAVETERAQAARRMNEAVAAAKLEHAAEKLRLETALGDLTRRLQRRTAGDLGDEGEVNVFELLKREFPEDDISRIACTPTTLGREPL